MDLTESDKKTLKLFSYYVNSHGSQECYMTYFYRAGALEWNDGVFYDTDGRAIETYEKIKALIERILNILNVSDWGTSDDNETKITINIFFTLLIYITYYIYAVGAILFITPSYQVPSLPIESLNTQIISLT